MTIVELTLLIALTAFAAGFLGAITGLGGGVVIVPSLALLFGVDIRYAIGASLVAVIATSSAAAAAYVREGFTNIRIGMFLEIATTVGAVVSASLASLFPAAAIAVIFGLVLLYSAYLSVAAVSRHRESESLDRLATRLKMNGEYPHPGGARSYHVRSVPAGFGLMFVAGSLSGLLGIGSGALKVIALDRLMRVPFKVSTTTSNFMIGVTAAASAGVYLHRGYIDPGLAMPVCLGVLAGSLIGTRLLLAARTRALRIVFALVITGLGIQMLVNGLTGRM
jgi:uncharacterized membrane protein YfcA